VTQNGIIFCVTEEGLVVHVLFSRDSEAVEAAREALPDAVVYDVDVPFEQLTDSMLPRDAPSPAVVEQARRNAAERVALLGAHGALTAEQVAELAGSQATNRRQTAHRWKSERAIFAVTWHDQLLFPAFQFDMDSGRPRAVVRDVLELLPDQLAGWALALWWTTPIAIDGAWVTPVDLLDAVERLRVAARQEAAAWRQDGAA
jgi:hypothetical protein